MIFLLVGDSGRWDLLPSMVRSVVSNGWSGRLRPQPGADTGAAALDVRPHPAVRLEAARGALDTDRVFRVTDLSEGELDSFALSSPGGFLVPLAGVDLDGSMAPRDLFPGSLTVTLDLEELGVPPGLYDLVDVYHVDAEGALRRQAVRRKGRRVEFELRNNGPILVGALAVAIGALFGQDQARKWGGIGDWLGGRYWFYDFGTYRIWYPRALGWRETPESLRVKAALEERWEANRPRSDGPGSTAGLFEIDRSERGRWAAAYLGDPEVQRLLRESWRNPAWV